MADSRIDELRRRLEREPGSRLFAQLAEEYRKAGEHAEAVRVARAGLVHHPSYPSARLTLGRALLDSGDPAGARVELEAALRDAPDNILASRFLGQALEASGELGPALLQLQATLKLAPGDRQLESQIVALQAKLRPRAVAPLTPPSSPSGTERRSGLTAPRPGTEVPGAPEESDDEPLPPTIRIRTSGDQMPRPGRAAAPPLPPSAAARVRATTDAPPPSFTPSAARARPTEGPAAAPAAAPRPVAEGTAPLFAEPFYESDVAPTLPTTHAPNLAATVGETEPTLPPGSVTAEETVFEEAAAPAGSPLASPTLAERAIEVYRQLLAEEPGNQRVRARLGQLEAGRSVRPDEARANRRKALERTIVGLEALLAAVNDR